MTFSISCYYFCSIKWITRITQFLNIFIIFFVQIFLFHLIIFNSALRFRNFFVKYFFVIIYKRHIFNLLLFSTIMCINSSFFKIRLKIKRSIFLIIFFFHLINYFSLSMLCFLFKFILKILKILFIRLINLFWNFRYKSTFRIIFISTHIFVIQLFLVLFFCIFLKSFWHMLIKRYILFFSYNFF